MATYTDNYNLIKPSYSEVADVATINTNMNTIDDIMHSSQVSLAPAYDSTQTYNTDDVVMYELLMYKCTDNNVTGTWNASKWERTTASECGDSGSDVEANPSGTATEELNKLRVNNTIYSIPEGSEVVVYGEASGNIAKFDDGSNKPMSKCIADINAVQNGSGDPSPQNIRQISGFDSVVIEQRGKNLFDPLAKTIAENKTNVYFWYNDGYKLPAGTYTISFKGNITLSGLYAIDKVNNVSIALTYNRNTLTFTITEEKMVTVNFYYVSGFPDTSDNLFQLERGSSVTAYEAYNGQTYSVSWQSQAGTVYGGNIDLVSGVLTVTHANIASYDGETLPSTWISDRDVYSVGGTPTAGAQVVYELATPLTYQLTPIQVNSLLGVNNVWNDTNGETEVKYIRDLNTTINILWNAVFNQSNTRSLSLMKSVKSEDTDTKEVEEIEEKETEKEVQKEIKKEEIND